MDEPATVTAGLSVIRGDFAHYCEMHGARTRWERLLLPFAAPALIALAVYRFGRFVRFGKPRRGLIGRALRITHTVLEQLAKHLTGVQVYVWVELEERVWLGPEGPLIIGAKRVGRGTRIHGGVTIGSGLSRNAPGLPALGRNVVVGPGAVIAGPIHLPDGSTVGPNTVLTTSPSSTSSWLGSPPSRFKRDPALLEPALPREARPMESARVSAEPFWPTFRRDLERYLVYQPGAGLSRKLILCALEDGIWALAVYRLGRALRSRGWLAFLARPVVRACELWVRIATGIHLDPAAEIGPGFYVGHHGAITVGAGSRLGPECNISQMCYVGPSLGSAGAAPRIGARVYLGPGSKVIGAATIGDRSAVAAGAVVLDDVPAGTTVVGNPARVVSKTGSDDLIYLGEGTPLATGKDARNLAAG
ncbi:MAG TPA: hypothetical protein VFE90_07785 [Myxococcales bacterium]|nr:hypothetical protein [Myxococcales bacterium]